MSSTYYTSLSGMLAASYGLQNTSNNVANMQSPGFKRSDVFYSSLGGSGSGVTIGGHSTNYRAGSYYPTNNPSDLAIVGNGFFIVKLKNGELLYTRDGEFEFNNDGMLIDKHSGGLVQGYDKHGALISIHQFGPKTSPGKASHFIDLKGQFVVVQRTQEEIDRDPLKQKYEHIKFDVNVYDTKGRSHPVTLEFEIDEIDTSDKKDDLKWNLISATCDGNIIDAPPQSIQFESNNAGAPELDYNTIKFNLNGNQPITLNFGDRMKDDYSSVRLYQKSAEIEHSSTSISINKQDGYGEGKQIGFSFDDNGVISYNYDNGQSETGAHVALALFDDLEHTLIQANDNLFRAKAIHGRTIGHPNQPGFGSIQAKKLESSNVDSTTEFGTILVLQRMFQACSQIMDIDKQLIEELYKR